MTRVLLLLALPSTAFSAAMVQHSTSLPVALGYVVAAPLVLVVVLGVLQASGVSRRVERSGWLGPAMLVAFFVVAAAAFAVIYPIADARKVIGGGTDTDDALDLAVRALLHGSYPYAEPTYLNNPISQLLGWIVLAAPFVLVFGRAAYLNVFWLGLWLAMLAIEAGSAWVAAVLATLTFVVFPGIPLTFLNGSDSFASLVAVAVLVVGSRRAPKGRWPLGLLAVTTGVVLSSRFNVVLLLSLLAASVGRRFGLARACAYAAVAGLVWLLVSFGPWLIDPSGFTPLHTYGMLGRFDSVIPRFGLLVPLATALLAVLLGGWVLGGGDVWLAMGLVLSMPVVCNFLAETAVYRHLDLWPLVYGLIATPVWVLAVAPAVNALLSAAPRSAPESAQPPFWRLMPRSAAARRS